MKIWLLYLLIPIMLLQSNMTIVICTSFYYNQNYIEKYLCLQRDMDINTCHGQCYLMQKLKDKQEKEQKNFKVNFQEDNLVSITIIETPNITSCTLEKLDYPSYYNAQLLTCNKNPLFRPPILA